MENVTNANFGPLIAYLVPGATVLVGFSQFSPVLRTWFGATTADAPSIGGFLYLTVSSIAVGMTVSALRWAFVDTLHSYTGLPLPPLKFSRLGKNVEAYVLLIEIHYRHYLFYSNMYMATAITYICYRVKLGGIWPLGWPDALAVVLEIVFFTTSRDTLAKYYGRSRQLLGTQRIAAKKVPVHTRTTKAARLSRRNTKSANKAPGKRRESDPKSPGDHQQPK